MQNFKTPLVFILVVMVLSCAKTNYDVNPQQEHSNVSPRSTTPYDTWVDTVKSFQREYFDHPQMSTLDVDYFYDKYMDINPSATSTFVDTLSPYMKRSFFSVEYVDLEDYLSATPFLSSSGKSQLLDLKDDVLTFLQGEPTQSEIHEFCSQTAQSALQDGSLHAGDQAAIFLSCVMVEASLDSLTEYSGGLQGSKGGTSQLRSACNFGDIALDFIIIASVGAVGVNALHEIGLIGDGWDYDYDYSEIFGGASGISISTLLALSSPATPYILVGSAIASILWNCFGLEEFFEDLWEGIKNFFTNLFGGSTDCNDTANISHLLLDCSGSVRFSAQEAGDDIVAWEWYNTNTTPQSITTQTRFFDFESTDDEVVIRVTPICSDEDVVLDQTTEQFTISDLLDNEPATSVQFVDWPSNPSTSVKYRYYIFTGAGPHEILQWTTDYGGTIQETGTYWVDVVFSVQGNRPVTATITDQCSGNFSTSTKTLFVD